MRCFIVLKNHTFIYRVASKVYIEPYRVVLTCCLIQQVQKQLEYNSFLYIHFETFSLQIDTIQKMIRKFFNNEQIEKQINQYIFISSFCIQRVKLLHNCSFLLQISILPFDFSQCITN